MSGDVPVVRVMNLFHSDAYGSGTAKILEDEILRSTSIETRIPPRRVRSCELPNRSVSYPEGNDEPWIRVDTSCRLIDLCFESTPEAVARNP
jgi:hypothetical protein